MTKEDADQELEQIQLRLQSMEEWHRLLSEEEHRLHARRHELMFLIRQLLSKSAQ